MCQELVHSSPIRGSCWGVGVVSSVLPSRSSSGLRAAMTMPLKKAVMAPLMASSIRPVTPPPPSSR
ncbi:hypothetical protein DVA86_31410 [Streptomyces armeniacus]|uniref:Uncharacterized protein n=1 Tax=Streptomyces armeniacus TaxID=83291 RepID=A0A345XXQ8_9ACTN|nr:hypothetical protein DVA86_31410 [Streptomyces armeniacus]